jgi:hypothetical protein
MLVRHRLVVLDTAHLAGLVADVVSDNEERRRVALRFVPDLIEKGWLLLLCWHHVEELLHHDDEDLVDARLRYLWSLPLLAWIRPADPGTGPGSIVDLLRSEVAAMLRSPGAGVLEVRDSAREDVIVVGPGPAAIPESFRDWRHLRPALAARQHGGRRVAAISPWRATDFGKSPIGTWFDRPARSLDEAARVLGTLRGQLAREIRARGDKRIADADAMANEFMQAVVRNGLAAVNSGVASPAVQLLLNAGLEPADIDPSLTFDETMDLLIFQKGLRVAADGLRVPWAEVKRSVTRAQLPVTVIEEAMRHHAQDQPERKGSGPSDTHLLCLAPYADVTFVDKRTMENVRRIRRKGSVVDQLMGEVARAANHGGVSKVLV